MYDASMLEAVAPVACVALKPKHVRPLSHFKLSNHLMCDP